MKDCFEVGILLLFPALGLLDNGSLANRRQRLHEVAPGWATSPRFLFLQFFLIPIERDSVIADIVRDYTRDTTFSRFIDCKEVHIFWEQLFPLTAYTCSIIFLKKKKAGERDTRLSFKNGILDFSWCVPAHQLKSQLFLKIIVPCTDYDSCSILLPIEFTWHNCLREVPGTLQCIPPK